MATNKPSFLNTDKEHRQWHHGLYTGLKVMQPHKMVKSLYIYDKNWRDWYRNDDHYHDFAVLAAFTGKWLAVVAGVRGLAALGL